MTTPARRPLPEEPDWFADRVRSPSPWDEIEIPLAYVEARVADWHGAALLDDDDPLLSEPQRLWRRRPREVVTPAATWTAMGGHGLIAWVHDGLGIARRLDRLEAELGPTDATLAEYVLCCAMYDGALTGGATPEDAQWKVAELLYTWGLSPRAYVEYVRRASAPATAGPMTQAAWLIAPAVSPAARDEVATVLMQRLGGDLDELISEDGRKSLTRLGSVFLALAEQAEAHRAWHRLAVAAEGIWPVPLDEARRALIRSGDAWLPRSADPTHVSHEDADPTHVSHEGPDADADLPLPTVEELMEGASPKERLLMAAFVAADGDVNWSALAREWGESPQATRQRFWRLRRRWRRTHGLPDD